jgi:D-sedoheptulose 7-phosphate isomerase
MNTQGFSVALAQFVDVLHDMQASETGRQPITAEEGIRHVLLQLQEARAIDNQVYLIGNGGSAAIVAHVRNDLVSKACMRAHVLHESSLLTCMSNDHGYERAYAEMLERFLRPGDILIAVSSSGRSENILQAVDVAHARGASTITLSGFSPQNPLRAKGSINFWLPSNDYGEIEVGHQLILHYLSDILADAK